MRCIGYAGIGSSFLRFALPLCQSRDGAVRHPHLIGVARVARDLVILAVARHRLHRLIAHVEFGHAAHRRLA